MSEKNKMASQESINATTTAASNTSSVVTVTAPAVGQTIFITGIIISASATIVTNPLAVTLTGVTGGTLTMQLPAASIAPLVLLFGVHPLRITPQVNAVLTLPALGTNVVGTSTLLYYIGAS
jgi:hypothetical protein